MENRKLVDETYQLIVILVLTVILYFMGEPKDFLMAFMSMMLIVGVVEYISKIIYVMYHSYKIITKKSE